MAVESCDDGQIIVDVDLKTDFTRNHQKLLKILAINPFFTLFCRHVQMKQMTELWGVMRKYFWPFNFLFFINSHLKQFVDDHIN
jgi:fatty-acid desaturase